MDNDLENSPLKRRKEVEIKRKWEDDYEYHLLAKGTAALNAKRDAEQDPSVHPLSP